MLLIKVTNTLDREPFDLAGSAPSVESSAPTSAPLFSLPCLVAVYNATPTVSVKRFEPHPMLAMAHHRRPPASGETDWLGGRFGAIVTNNMPEGRVGE